MCYFDKPEIQEECGVFGIHSSYGDAARTAFFGLFSLQHRGQESAGIAVSDGNKIKMHRDMGLVTQVFQEQTLVDLSGNLGIGHVRYSTTGSSVLRNVQPMKCECNYGPIALAHNGDLINAAVVRDEMLSQGISFETTNDSEVIIKIIANSCCCDIEDAICEAIKKIKGAYACIVLTLDKLIAFRDPHGIRPLCIGKINGGNDYVVASESCAIDTIGASSVREVKPGEMIIIDKNGMTSKQAVPFERNALCIFEYVYFARPDSRMNGVSIHEARRRMGHQLAIEHPITDADMVFPIPDTGIPAAIGLAEASKIPYAEGVIKNRYIHRTFIQPDQRMRDRGVRMKLTPLTEALIGKKVVMVEDSIVRGTTIGPTIKMIREAGAKEIHVRIASPPYKHPCFYGIDTANQNELIAAKLNVEEIRQYIGADSLGYLSLEGLVKAIGIDNCNLCCACLDGKYPIEIPDEAKLSKYVFEEPTPA
ncbi:MAG: amidophosphoribosyltransferase [Armatimonadota bacterium]